MRVHYKQLMYKSLVTMHNSLVKHDQELYCIIWHDYISDVNCSMSQVATYIDLNMR